jgi:hypothetical protein
MTRYFRKVNNDYRNQVVSVICSLSPSHSPRPSRLQEMDGIYDVLHNNFLKILLKYAIAEVKVSVL